MLTYLAEQINPKVYGLLDVKKKILLCLASGEDKWGDRGRLHLLARGDPGTAKSALGEWLVHNLGIEGLSHRSSDVGLTGCVVGKEVIPGALPCANGGAIYIDELDKFDYKDYAGLLQAMESGEIVIRVGAVKARFDARCRVIASINNIEKLPPELLDRFDFKVEMVPPKLEEELMITENIVKQWWEKKPSFFGEEFRRYLQWIKSYEPEFSAEVKDKAATIMKMYIELDKENMCGSMRKKESLIRIATTIAKIHRRAVMAEDFIEAIRLTNPSFNGVKLEAIKMKISQLQQN
jgi:DNA replicative helicase MCM subunit Mcm2 (Cdc46/Mcm family)